jgi:hypothetical protein
MVCYRFQWAVGQKDHLHYLELKAGNPRMEYVTMGQNVERLTAKLNLSHMELPDGSDISFQLFCNHFPRNVHCKILVAEQTCRISAVSSSYFSAHTITL